jgi:Bacterial transglutaminase-like N-terminal region
MKRIRIIHKTEYFYNQPVTFNPHRALMRPREGHDVHIVRGAVDIAPKATVRWLRDIYDNAIAIVAFEEASDTLRIASEVDVDLYCDDPVEWRIAPYARSFPFQYEPAEHIDLMIYRLPSYPYDGTTLLTWLRELYGPGQVIDTFDLLNNLNTHIYRSFKYDSRDAFGGSVAQRHAQARQRNLP